MGSSLFDNMGCSVHPIVEKLGSSMLHLFCLRKNLVSQDHTKEETTLSTVMAHLEKVGSIVNQSFLSVSPLRDAFKQLSMVGLMRVFHRKARHSKHPAKDHFGGMRPRQTTLGWGGSRGSVYGGEAPGRSRREAVEARRIERWGTRRRFFGTKAS